MAKRPYNRLLVCCLFACVVVGTAGAQSQNRADAAAYAGLVGDREREPKVTDSPRDKFLIVTDNSVPRRRDDPMLALPDDVRQVITAACAADAVVTARIVSVEPFLNPASTWIFTRHRLHISEVIKTPADRSLGAGSELTYVHPSGATILGSVSASTVVLTFPLLQADHEYLFFLKSIPETGHYALVSDIPVLVGGSTWTAHVKSPTGVAPRLRTGVPQAEIFAQVAGASCRGVK